ncbi:MAG: SDR family oxidoreductase [Nitrosotalea sp.]
MNVKDLFNLKNNVSVVTGGAGHLGLALSEALAEAGSDVYIVSRNEEKCKKAAKSIQKCTGANVKGLSVDISSMISIIKCFNEIVKKSGRIDVLVNNAAFAPLKKFEKMSDEDWIRGIDGTINGVYRTTKAAIPIMEKNKGGSIINISSMYGTVSPDPSIYGNSGFDNPPNYGAGKAAIVQFTRYLACHMAKKGIRANAVSPGPFPNLKVQKNKTFISNLEKKTPLGRIGLPYELKGITVFLASKASSYVTGQNIHVDGGWTAW